MSIKKLKIKKLKIPSLQLFKRSQRIKDTRKTTFNRIVCEDTGEICRSYSEYISSKHWRLFRKRFKESSFYSGKCLICSSEKAQELHHTTYLFVGREHIADNYKCIVVLCKRCHLRVHSALRRGKKTWEQIVKQLEELL